MDNIYSFRRLSLSTALALLLLAHFARAQPRNKCYNLSVDRQCIKKGQKYPNFGLVARAQPEIRELRSNFAGIVFALRADNTLVQLDSGANITRRFSGQNATPFQHIQFRNRWQLFLFSPDNQTVTLLDRFLTPIDRYTFDLKLGWIGLAAPSADQSVWLFDETSLRLLRYDLRLGEIIGQTALNLILAESAASPDQLEEYQNQLFLNVPDLGVLVFDALGNFREKLPFAATGRFQFRDDKLCFWEAERQRFVCWHLYEKRLRYITSAYPEQRFTQALWLRRAHWYAKGNTIKVFEVP